MSLEILIAHFVNACDSKPTGKRQGKGQIGQDLAVNLLDLADMLFPGPAQNHISQCLLFGHHPVNCFQERLLLARSVGWSSDHGSQWCHPSSGAR